MHAEASIRFEGSSPLTRGKLACFGRADAFPGLIPAHAGKTELPRSAGSHHRAHPRSCRENRTGVFQDIPEHGSSPLMQGKPNRGVPGHPRARLIPAHAGKTLISNGEIPKGRAHPRSRGENRSRMFSESAPAGSSPLTRGKQRPQPHARQTGRLIPAHAGKTHPARIPRPRAPAHPRSRGENSGLAVALMR